MPMETDKIHALLGMAATGQEPNNAQLAEAVGQCLSIVEQFFTDIASIADSLSVIAQNSGK